MANPNRGRLFVFTAWACLVVPATVGAAVDAFDSGKRAFDNRSWARAVPDLRAYLAASLADPRREKAVDMLVKASENAAADLFRPGQPSEATSLLLESAKAIEPGPQSGELMAFGRQSLRENFDAALKHRHFDEAVEAATAWGKHFPGDPALADDADLSKYRAMAIVADLPTMPPALAYSQLQQLQAQSRTPEETATLGIDAAPIFTKYVDSLLADGWYEQAIAVGERALSDGTTLTDDKRQKVQATCVKAGELSVQA